MPRSKRRCEQVVGDKPCGLQPLGILDGVALCSQLLFWKLRRKAA